MWFAELGGLLLVGYFGACLASFWGVVWSRAHQRQKWWQGRSRCDHCHQQLRWWENLPLISYLMLKGRCRRCRHRIEPLLFWWELISFLWWFGGSAVILRHFVPIWWYFLVMGGYFLFGWCLWWVSLIDIKTKMISDGWLIVFASLTGSWSLLQIFLQHLSGQELVLRLGMGIIFSLFFFSLNWLGQKIWRQESLGSGDALLVLIMALWLPVTAAGWLVLFSFWLGAIAGLMKIAVGWAKPIRSIRDRTLPFVPFLSLGFWLALWWGERLTVMLF